jgi:hypothetical protein
MWCCQKPLLSTSNRCHVRLLRNWQFADIPEGYCGSKPVLKQRYCVAWSPLQTGWCERCAVVMIGQELETRVRQKKYGQSLSRFRLSRCASQMFYQIKMIPFLAPYRLASFKKADENMLLLICDFFKSPITFISLPYVGTRFVGVSLFADFCSPCVENVICWRGCTIYFQTPCTVIRWWE